jgi:hypothetical protein
LSRGSTTGRFGSRGPMKALAHRARIAHGRPCRKTLWLCRQEDPQPRNWRGSNLSNAPSALVAHKGRGERSGARPKKNPNAGTRWGSQVQVGERRGTFVPTEFDTLTVKLMRQVSGVVAIRSSLAPVTPRQRPPPLPGPKLIPRWHRAIPALGASRRSK